MNEIEEYLHRNSNHSKSIGVCAGIRYVIDRVGKMKRPPKWIIDTLSTELKKAESVEREAVIHREEMKRGRELILERLWQNQKTK